MAIVKSIEKGEKKSKAVFVKGTFVYNIKIAKIVFICKAKHCNQSEKKKKKIGS